MNRITILLSQIILLVAVTFSITGCVTDNYPDCPDTPGSETTAQLRIRVAAPDPQSGSRSDIYYIDHEALKGELMHSLRIIIVREDGTVEHNRSINLNAPSEGLKLTDYETFIVKANEQKTVYAFANEESLPDGGYAVRSVKIGEKLRNDFDQLTITVGEVKTPLFMSRKTIVEKSRLTLDNISTDDSGNPRPVYHTIFIIRASVKFTYTITNSSPFDFSVSQIMFNGLTDTEYLLPTNINDITDRNQYITQYSTPDDLQKGTKILADITEENGTIATGKAKTFSPYYCNEAPIWGVTSMPFIVPDEQTGKSPYSTSITLSDGSTLWDGAFNNLPALPRNTHVIIKINVKNINSDVHCIVDVVPYIGINLEPNFGFDDLIPKPGK